MAAEQQQLKDQEAESQSAPQAEQEEPSGEPDQNGQGEAAGQDTDQNKDGQSNTETPVEEAEVQPDEVQSEAEDNNKAQGQSGTQKNLDRILSMKIPVIVRIAQKRITLGEVLKFNLGSIIQFEQDADQHVDLMVNNSIIGLGQAVKLGENFGLKITQIADVTDTIKSLGGQN